MIGLLPKPGLMTVLSVPVSQPSPTVRMSSPDNTGHPSTRGNRSDTNVKRYRGRSHKTVTQHNSSTIHRTSSTADITSTGPSMHGHLSVAQRLIEIGLWTPCLGPITGLANHSSIALTTKPPNQGCSAATHARTETAKNRKIGTAQNSLIPPHNSLKTMPSEITSFSG